jgi:hypothetical protein
MVRKNVINSHIYYLGASNSQASLSSSSFNPELSSSGNSSDAADSGSGDSKGSSTLTTKLPVSSHLRKKDCYKRYVSSRKVSPVKYIQAQSIVSVRDLS